MSEKMHYYEVSVALDGSWKQSIYTYSSPKHITSGQVVIVPFGKAKKLGCIIDEVEKPKFSVKPLEILDSRLPKRSVELLQWLSNYYPTAQGVHTAHLLPSFLVSSLPAIDDTKPEKKHNAEFQTLTHAQEKAIAELADSTRVVLHGITGSGKTRVYMERIRQEIEAGHDVLLLYPEISLTTQLHKTLGTYFGASRIHIYHSKRTKKQQMSTWHAAAKSSGGNIFIGPRSALFLPYQKLALVIVDEAHDSAYKQESGTRYNGLLVAAALSSIHNAQLILGSATPPVQETYQLLQKGGKLVCMHELATTTTTTETVFDIIDMTKQTEHYGQNHLFSKKLNAAIQSALEQKSQVLLFLNKRGTARMILCESCGWHATCARCELPLTFHHDTFTMLCHVCGQKSEVLKTCPSCNKELVQKNFGIKAVEVELRRLFPQTRIARFDSDNKKADSFAEQYESIARGDADIILGTQLITKGLDLPKLSTVGILQADSALMLPDYISEERAFQQLTQVSGRVGRGHMAGTVILQSYQPDNPLLHGVKTQDWHTFYEEEIQNRKEAQYPPFAFLMKVIVAKKTEKAAHAAAQKIADSLSKVRGIKLFGPAPSFYEKTRGEYKWQLILKATSRQKLIECIHLLPKDAIHDIDPVSLL